MVRYDKNSIHKREEMTPREKSNNIHKAVAEYEKKASKLKKKWSLMEDRKKIAEAIADKYDIKKDFFFTIIRGSLESKKLVS